MTFGARTAGGDELVTDRADQHQDQSAVADHRAALHRRDRVRADSRRRHDERHARQLRGPARQRIEPEAGARGDRAADERPVRGDDVERGGRAQVDDDRRRAVETQRGVGVDEPVIADGRSVVDADLDGNRRFVRDENGNVPPRRVLGDRGAHVRHDADHDDLVRLRELRVQHLLSVGEPSALGTERDEATSPSRMSANRHVRVAHVNCQDHVPIIRGDSCNSGSREPRSAGTIAAFQRPVAEPAFARRALRRDVRRACR